MERPDCGTCYIDSCSCNKILFLMFSHVKIIAKNGKFIYFREINISTLAADARAFILIKSLKIDDSRLELSIKLDMCFIILLSLALSSCRRITNEE